MEIKTIVINDVEIPSHLKKCQYESYSRFFTLVSLLGGKIIGEYVNTNKKVEIFCRFGHNTLIYPKHLLNKCTYCYECSYDYPEKAKARFYAKIEENGGIILEEYVNAKKKRKIICYHGHTFYMSPNSVSQGHWCIKCANICPVQAYERLSKIVEEKGGIILTDYINTWQKVKFKCKKDHEFPMAPQDVKQGEWCPYCSGCSPIVAKEKFEKIVEEKGGQIIGKGYSRTTDEVCILCSKKHVFITKPAYIIGGSWCDKCTKGKQYSKDQILWLKWISLKEDIYIHHAENGKEAYISGIGKFDGYCEETETIYEYHGAFFHGHPDYYDPEKKNPLTKKNFGLLYKNTLIKDEKIRQTGNNYVVIWDFEFKLIRKQVLQDLKENQKEE